MEMILALKKDKKQKNILFDELFHEANEIHIIAFNYDNEGSALCRCDGQIQKISKARMERLLFGLSKAHLDELLTSIFNPDMHLSDSPRHGEAFEFRMEALRRMSKYEVGNLAKQTKKELQQAAFDVLAYFTAQPAAGGKSAPVKKKKKASVNKTKGAQKSKQVWANKKTKIFHSASCPRFNAKTCTEMFENSNKAESAGFKPCTLCKP